MVFKAINILLKEEPPKGNYPEGLFHSSTDVTGSFFSTTEKERKEKLLTEVHMPFLYGMIRRTLTRPFSST